MNDDNDTHNKNFYANPGAFLKKIGEDELAKKVAELIEKARQAEENVKSMEERRRAEAAITEVLKENPQFTAKTRVIAEWILQSYPKLDHSKAFELTVPYVLNIAYKIEQILDHEISEELR